MNPCRGIASLISDSHLPTGSAEVPGCIKLENLTLEELGRVKTVTVDKENTTLVEGHSKSSEIQGRVNQIRLP